MYHYSHLEDYIKQFYIRLGINHPTLLNLKTIANKIDIRVFYWSDNSQALFIYGSSFIFINENLSKAKQWQDFCHELCHVLLHTGDQFYMSPLFREYQENKANNFMYHACIPTFMLDELKQNGANALNVHHIQELFNVEYHFALKRVEQYITKTQII